MSLVKAEITLFISTFVTLLAIINPLEVLPVYLKLVSGETESRKRAVAWKACFYALVLCFFFLIFGNLILRLFDVPLSMVRIVGGIILMKIGFDLFSPPAAPSGAQAQEGASAESNVAFVPLALPLMCGPGAIATILGMTATVKHAGFELYAFAAVSAAIVLTMFVTFIALAYASKLTAKIGPMGIDATTRIVGFFVSAMGVGLIFNGVIEALEQHGLKALH
ncbi:multiple antibiotic resistance protein [Rhodoblastus acidophilus]|nr:multiple antibiotic resistance protein [Rhodoblastus acidophilus]MCW2331475.1 multiple antibiotic resistance protein [Rhodoblastus acidophilus]